MPQKTPVCSVQALQETFAAKVEALWPTVASLSGSPGTRSCAEGDPTNLLPRRAVLAVSGGGDSTAMTLLAKDGSRKFFEYLVVAHFHHHLREEEGESEAVFVKGLAADLELPFVRGDWSPKERGSFHRVDRNLQAAARKARYTFLLETAHSHECPVLLTAHHARDQVETLLHNLARGGRSGAFQGIRPRIQREGTWVLRPLLWTFPEEIRAFLHERAQVCCEDSSNLSTKYRRNWIRNELLPKLREADPRFEIHLLSRWNSFQEEAETVESLLDTLKARSLRRQGSWVIPLETLNRLSQEHQVRCLRFFLRDLVKEHSPHGWDPIRQVPLEQLLELIEKGNEGVVNLPGEIRAEVRGNGLSLTVGWS